MTTNAINARTGASGRPERRAEERHAFIENVVGIRRVSKVVKGGRNVRFTAMVIVGDGKGRVGAALGKGASTVDAIRKGSFQARKSMVKVNLKGTTVPHQLTAKFGATKVLLRPAGEGTGIVAGYNVRAVLQAAGVTDVLTKRFGSPNAINTVKATINGLYSMLDTDYELARRRGKVAKPAPASDNQE